MLKTTREKFSRSSLKERLFAYSYILIILGIVIYAVVGIIEEPRGIAIGTPLYLYFGHAVFWAVVETISGDLFPNQRKNVPKNCS